MRYTKLGATGLDVSVVALGCMSFGEPGRGYPSWSMGEEASRDVIRHAVEAGITFFDTANVYSAGSSEEIVGRALRDYANRDEIVIATKVRGEMRPGPNGQGLSRKAILAELDASLRRLGTDYVDLYQIHRWDPDVPLEETLQTLDDVVRAGKVRYLGASSMYAWRFSKALHLQRARGWARFVAMQNHYNLLNREDEREMLPLCLDEGVGAIPWSPLARGRLTRDWDERTERSAADGIGFALYTDRTADADRAVVEAVAQVAAQRGVPRAQVALAWLVGRPAVSAPLVGARTLQQIDDAVAAAEIVLTDDEVATLEATYTPHAVAGY